MKQYRSRFQENEEQDLEKIINKKGLVFVLNYIFNYVLKNKGIYLNKLHDAIKEVEKI